MTLGNKMCEKVGTLKMTMGDENTWVGFDFIAATWAVSKSIC